MTVVGPKKAVFVSVFISVFVVVVVSASVFVSVYANWAAAFSREAKAAFLGFVKAFYICDMGLAN